MRNKNLAQKNMKNIKLLTVFLTIVGSTGFSPLFAQDILLQKNLTVITDNFDDVLVKTENNVKVFVDNFNVKLDSGSKLKSPKSVTGTILEPVLKLSVRKCVFVICNTVDLDLGFRLVKEASDENCDVKYTLLGDLRRSSDLLSNNYSDLNTAICLKRTTTGANARLVVTLLRERTYKNGTVQSEILKFIKLQADGIAESFKKVLILNGVKQIN